MTYSPDTFTVGLTVFKYFSSEERLHNNDNFRLDPCFESFDGKRLWVERRTKTERKKRIFEEIANGHKPIGEYKLYDARPISFKEPDRLAISSFDVFRV